MQGVHGNLGLPGGWAGLAILAIFATSIIIGLSFGGSGTQAAAAAGNENWRVAEPVTYENLSVFPVLAKNTADTSAFATLDEALASGDAVVSEQGAEMIRRSREGAGTPDYRTVPLRESGAQVNQLVLVNRGKRPLLLLAGEVISGGKQDRIIGKDRIVPVGGEPLPLNVFCVERGRWSVASAFVAAKMMAHPSVREKAAVAQNQSEVWATVQAGTSSNLEASSRVANAAPALSADALRELESTEAPTGSYVKMYGSPRVKGSVENFAQEVERRFARATANLKDEHLVGVVVSYGGEVAWSDVFASQQLFERYWPKLLRSYVVEALARPELKERASVEDAREFLTRAGGHERAESEPGVYRWIERTQDSFADIELESLAPKTMTLHWLKVLRTN